MDLVGGAVDPRGGYVLKILHVKMKESGPVGGRAPPLDPPMQTTTNCQTSRSEISNMSLCLVLPHVITICDGKADGSFCLLKDLSHAAYMSLAHTHRDIIEFFRNLS